MAEKCGAKTRAGGRCAQAGNPKNGRCRFHGGMSTGAKHQNTATNALKHGIYSRHFSPEELAEGSSIKLGNVDTELRICRLRLSRALAAEAAARNQPELEEIIERDVAALVGAKSEKKWRLQDYNRVIDGLMARIESLEKTRLLLRIELGLTDEEMNADALTPGDPDETPPPKPIR